MDTKEAGKIGGLKLMAEKGADYYRTIQLKSAKAKVRNNKLKAKMAKVSQV